MVRERRVWERERGQGGIIVVDVKMLGRGARVGLASGGVKGTDCNPEYSLSCTTKASNRQRHSWRHYWTDRCMYASAAGYEGTRDRLGFAGLRLEE